MGGDIIGKGFGYIVSNPVLLKTRAKLVVLVAFLVAIVQPSG